MAYVFYTACLHMAPNAHLLYSANQYERTSECIWIDSNFSYEVTAGLFKVHYPADENQRTVCVAAAVT